MKPEVPVCKAFSPVNPEISIIGVGVELAVIWKLGRLEFCPPLIIDGRQRLDRATGDE